MKNSKLVKKVLVIIMSLTLIIVSKNVFAQSLPDDTLSGSTGNSATTGTGTTTLRNSAITGTGTNTITGTGTTKNTITTPSNTMTSNKVNNTVLKTSNTSSYNNSSLPKTGVEDSMPIVVLAVVLGISAIYAYKKIQDYKNI